MQDLLNEYQTIGVDKVKVWVKAGTVDDFPTNGGACIKYKKKQIAVFNFTTMSRWYACQNLCPHKMEMVISRGMIGDKDQIPKVACPLHKKTFSLENGTNMEGEDYKLATYPVRIADGAVFVGFSE
ncbi:nitrite reductase small subunit NirD [Membranihabitans maritimus]|uniref:nitrite reductase small subunit NirD n=1 Tax=Membranihabitans maritimus TaxID=2904244 RepID=UPI001F02FE4D|nr:nitrite reductase small subunit NirD [Membranihabitans maritimus]